MINEEKKFYCYSLGLKNFLKLQKINYTNRSKHIKTGKYFWIYPSSEALDKALANWNVYKEIFGKEQ